MLKSIYFPEKIIYVPTLLKISDLLPETHFFYLTLLIIQIPAKEDGTV